MRKALAERFWEKVDKSGDCWLWTGCLFKDGYGSFQMGGKHGRPYRAHRVAYELTIGPIPAGLQLDHVRARGCRNKHCVNPAHLEPVTNRENTLRGRAAEASRARAASRTHCKNRHELTPDNTYVSATNGSRECRICRRAAARRYRKRAAA